jgi:hypothetical protein
LKLNPAEATWGISGVVGKSAPIMPASLPEQGCYSRGGLSHVAQRLTVYSIV